jgi:mutator protein MutT
VSQQRVIACVIARGERLLVCQRGGNKRHAGLWEFPGGKLEAGETDRSAAARELLEELGVELMSATEPMFEMADADSEFTIAFLPVEILGQPICHEHSALLWATQAQLMELPLAPTDAAFVRFHFFLSAN